MPNPALNLTAAAGSVFRVPSYQRPRQGSLVAMQRRIVVAKHLYLRKASDDFVSHCKCDKANALISSPGWDGSCRRPRVRASSRTANHCS